MAEAWASRFYNSKEWKDLRWQLIIKRGPKCARCGKDMTFNTAELIGHHIIPLTKDNVRNPEVALNPDNVELICFDCHNAEHERFGHKHERQVFLIYGPPCSGKSTLVNQMSTRGDLIIDMDLLYRAVSGLDLYDKPDCLRSNVLAIYHDLINQVKTRYGGWHDAYIVGGFPLRGMREAILKQTGGTAVMAEASMDECLAAAGARGIFADEWKKYITKWFETYQK